MDNALNQKTPWHLWVVGGVSLLWNSGGIISYLTTKLGGLEGADFPPEQLVYFNSFPAWASAFWALGVWGCFLGSLFLLLRSRWAVTLFGISIIGLIGTTAYQRLSGDLPASMQTMGHNLFAAAIWVITIGLFIYASRMRRAGVLR
ncbi:MAG: hypothetical protein AAF250_13690 [Pseudomonadota bacterium]